MRSIRPRPLMKCSSPLVLLAALLFAVPAVAQSPASFPPRLDVAEATVRELQSAMERGDITAVQLVDEYLARIEAYDRGGPMLNAIIRVNPRAREEAALLDRERGIRGSRGPLHGIPVILKDNFDTVDMPTSAGSIALAGLLAPDDGFQVRRLREAGAIILAKSNLHELASGITTISSLGGQTLNPYDPHRNPGGSSGGTAVAVAAGMAPLGWGSDTCGSIRIPAALNNLFGLRPTKGLSSIDGIIPLSHTQDVAGPLARTATDLAIALDATIGPDPKDPATRILDGVQLPRFVDALDRQALQGARIGVLTAHFGSGPEEREVGRVVRAALEEMKGRGAEVADFEIVLLDSLLAGTSVIDHEFKWDLIDYLAATPGAPVASITEILERGLYHAELEGRLRQRNHDRARDSEEYRTALARQAVVRERVLAAMTKAGLDALAYPSLRREAAIIGQPPLGANCQLSAATGMPALSIPVGFTPDGVPVGLELLGKPLDDARLLAIGYAYEQAARPRRTPTLTPPLEGGAAPRPISFAVAATGAAVVPAAPAAASARGRFTYDRVRGILGYDVQVEASGDAVFMVTLQRGRAGTVGAVIHRLVEPGASAGAGTLELWGADREALLKGEIYLQVYTRDHPIGAARGQLLLPQPP